MREPPRARPLIAVADDDATVRRLLERWFENAGYDARTYCSGDDLLDDLERLRPDAVCTDVQMPGRSGLEVVERIRASSPETPIVVFSGAEGIETAVEAMRRGALDFVVKPLDHGRLFEHLRPALRQLDAETMGPIVPGMIGDAPPMRELFEQIERVADANISVLIRGESGTGKELVANAIHQLGRRANDPFVALNCGAIPESLQESELFGHEKGAFTGATSSHAGKFERAAAGTIFLDEIAELSSSTQVRLLRVLQERKLERVGGRHELDVRARVISASHKDLGELVNAGVFREDLYYRLAVYPVYVPPLRSRREDIPALAAHFLRKHASDVGRAVVAIEPAALALLERHSWPGNVRELENTIYGAMVRARGDVVDLAALPDALRRGPFPSEHDGSRTSAMPPSAPPLSTSQRSPQDRDVMPLEEMERRAIIDALERCGHNVSRAAKELGIGRATIYRRMDRFGIKRTG